MKTTLPIRGIAIAALLLSAGTSSSQPRDESLGELLRNSKTSHAYLENIVVNVAARIVEGAHSHGLY